MAVFKAVQSGVEVNGETIPSFVDGMGAHQGLFREVLKKNGIADPLPVKWCSQQAWLDAFKEISEKIGPASLKRIGSNIPQNAKWPPDVTSIPAALQSIDAAYHMNHRKGLIGSYTCTLTGERAATIFCDNPYPCAFDQGLIYAAAKKFAGPNDHVMVRHGEGGLCRMTGNGSCTYYVTW